jgi:hypothetical protein
MLTFGAFPGVEIAVITEAGGAVALGAAMRMAREAV